MTILKKTKMLVSFLVPFGLSEEASASFALGQNHGIGMYPAQAQCPYPSEMADEIAGLEADRRDTRDRLSEIKRELRRAKRRLSEAEKRVDAEKTKFQNSGLTGTAYNTIDNHISGKLRCSGYETERCRPREVDYRRRSPPRDRSGSGAPAEASIDRIDPVEALLALNGFGEVSATRNVATETRPPSGLDDAEPDSGPRVPRERTECPGGLRPVDPFTPNVWARACRGSQLSGSICRDAPDAFRAEKFNIRACERSLVDWYKKNAELNAANDEVNQLQAELDSLDSDEKELKKEIREAKRDASEERRRMISEGGFESIMQGSVSRGPQRTGPNLVEIGGNVIFGLASMYFGQQQQRFISDNNAKLGFATQTHPSWGYGWPYFGNALYGATQGGMSSGSFGCSTGFGNGGGSGGVFGYPPGMMGGPQSGGLFNNGFGPGGYGVPMNGMTGLPYGYLGNAGMGFQMNGPESPSPGPPLTRPWIRTRRPTLPCSQAYSWLSRLVSPR
jgi:outer membrane murein-binding lipoprotein Lpp